MGVLVWIFCVFCASLECHKEQRATLKSCASWGFDAGRTIHGIQAAYGDHALSHTQICHWLRIFQADPTRPVSDKKHCGQLVSQRTESKIKQVEDIVLDDRCKTTRQEAREASMSHTTACKVLRKDLRMTKIAAIFVPHKFTGGQRKSRMDICNTHLCTIKEDPTMLNRIVACDESWIYTYDPRSKAADIQWVTKDEPRPIKCLCPWSQKKVILTLFFDSNGIISVDFLEDGTVDLDTYIDSLKWMREAYRCKRPHLWQNRQFHLLQDNGRPGNCCPPHAQIHSKSGAWCFNDLATRYEKCVEAKGAYFETRGRRPICREPQN